MSARLDHARTPAELRDEAADVLRYGAWGVRAIIVVALLALVFTMVNVQTFAAAGHPIGSFHWWIAWLLDPMASVAFGAAIVFENLLARYREREGWLSATKWLAGVATWSMNIWASVVAASPSGVLLHSVAPALVLFMAESAPRVRRKMGGIVAELERQAQRIEAEEAAARQAEAQEQQRRADEATRLAREEREAQRRTTPTPKRAVSTSPKRTPVRTTDLTTVVAWAAGELAAGESAGWRRIQRECGLKEHQAKKAAQQAREKHERPVLTAVAR